MKRLSALAFASLAICSATSPSEKLSLSKSGKDNSFQSAFIAEAAGDCPTAQVYARSFLKSGSDRLPPAATGEIYNLLISCDLRIKADADAVRDSRAVTESPYSTERAWFFRFLSEYRAELYPDAINTLETMSKSHGAALNSIPSDWFWRLHFTLERSNQTSLDTRLLRIAVDSAYQPPDPAYFVEDVPATFRVMLASNLLVAGDKAEALTYLDNLRSVQALTYLLADSDVRTLRPQPIDFRQAAEADLAWHQTLTLIYPNSVQLITAVGNDLIRLGRPEEALAALEVARPRINSPIPFADAVDQVPKWWNALADAYFALGKYDEMVASFSEPTKGSATGGGNLNQVINLAAQQIAFGRYKEALKTLPPGDVPASPYGAMQLLEARGCALALSGDTAAALKQLAVALTREAGDSSAITGLYICLGNEDAAAQSLVKRLSDRKLRRLALLEVANYDPPIKSTPVDPRFERRAALLKRSDVQAAIAAAGGQVRVALQPNSLAY